LARAKPENVSTTVKAMSESSAVRDALFAEEIARSELIDRFGKGRILKITVSKVALLNNQSGGAWEVEGNTILKLGVVGKRTKHFQYRIDTTSGKIIGFKIEDVVGRPTDY
jgi:hypothetical protein